jgi:hypothetical protein
LGQAGFSITSGEEERIYIMTTRRYGMITMILSFALLTSIPTGCGSPVEDGPSMQDIPLYPKANEGESMEGSSPGGFLGGNLEQFTTTDPYEDVVDFYTDALTQYSPEFVSNASDLGRQTAISIPQKNGMISIAIQEFVEEGTVNITFMAVGG